MPSSRVPSLDPHPDPVSSSRAMVVKPRINSEDIKDQRRLNGTANNSFPQQTQSESLAIVDLSSGPRISSYNRNPVRFNRKLLETRMRVVKSMVYSSYKALEREFELEQQRNAEMTQKEQEAILRNKQSIRRQLVRGQELDEVQTSVVSYDFASSQNAEADLQLAKSMLVLVTSVKSSRERYEASLKSRLQAR